MSKRYWLGVCIIVVALVIIGGVTGLIWHMRSSAGLPKAISQQLDFEPRVLKADVNVKVATLMGSYKYDQSTKVLTFIVLVGNTKVVISEQSYPDILVYGKLVNAFNIYSEIDTKTGKVSLGRPKDNGGGQAAVVHANNLLIFGKPDKDLTDEEWKAVFNNLSQP